MRKACIPSANGHFTARALAKFYAALASGGTLNGHTILSPTAVETMAEVKATTTSGSGGFASPIQWGRGVRKFTFRTDTGTQRSVAFGHMGMGGSMAFCDPVEGFSIAVTVNKLTLDASCSRAIVNHITTALGVGELQQ